MSFDINRIHKSVRRVRKFLRKNSKTPSPDAIHNLRTSARSLESTFVAVGLDSTGHVRRFLDELRKVRKRAGKVRDRDVLTADALSVHLDGEQNCLVELVEYLGAGRTKYAKKLGLVVERGGKRLRRDLERSFKSLEKLLERQQTIPPIRMRCR